MIKKFLRVIFRIFLVILMMVITLAINFKISENKNIPELLNILVFVLLTSITIVAGVILLSNPTVKIPINRKTKIKKHKKTGDFLEICEKLEQKYGEILEGYRKKAIIYILLIILALLFTFLITVLFKNFNFSLMLGGGLNLILIFLYIENKKKFNIEFKKKIIPGIVSFISPTLHYYYDGDRSMFHTYKLVFPDNDEYNGYESTDYIHGKMHDIPLEICKISLMNFSNKTNEEINRIETFLFSRNKINFSLPTTLTIKPNNYFNIHKIDKVEMDSQEFEKYFDVFSSSDIVAMQVLTHDVMEELADFYIQYGCKFEVIIKDNNIFIKFITGDVFNPKVTKKVVDSDLLWMYYTILNFVTSLCIKINKSFEGKVI